MDHPVIIFPNSLVRECDEVRGPAGSVADDDGHRRRVRHVLEHGADSVGAALDHQAADPSEHIVQQQCVIIRLISNNFERVGILKMDLMITVSPSPPKIYCWSGYGCYQPSLQVLLCLEGRQNVFSLGNVIEDLASYLVQGGPTGFYTGNGSIPYAV